MEDIVKILFSVGVKQLFPLKELTVVILIYI